MDDDGSNSTIHEHPQLDNGEVPDELTAAKQQIKVLEREQARIQGQADNVQTILDSY